MRRNGNNTKEKMMRKQAKMTEDNSRREMVIRRGGWKMRKGEGKERQKIRG